MSNTRTRKIKSQGKGTSKKNYNHHHHTDTSPIVRLAFSRELSDWLDNNTSCELRRSFAVEKVFDMTNNRSPCSTTIGPFSSSVEVRTNDRRCSSDAMNNSSSCVV